MKVDHIVLVASDLTSGCDEFESLTGVRPAYGGQHSDGRTENALSSLGNRQYLEILTARKAADDSDAWIRFCRASKRLRVLTICLAPEEGLGAMAQRARELGLLNTDIVDGSRIRPDGTELAWQLCKPQHLVFEDRFPFFIQWSNASHPSDDAPGGLRLEAVSLHHPKADVLAPLFESLGLPLSVHDSDDVAYQVRLAGPAGPLVLG